jgi:hypothetical protein
MNGKSRLSLSAHGSRRASDATPDVTEGKSDKLLFLKGNLKS